MATALLFLLARVAVPMRINLNWLSPRLAWRRGEPLFVTEPAA